MPDRSDPADGIGTGRSIPPALPTLPGPSCLASALHWIDLGMGVVPLHPLLSENPRGRPAPLPLVRWQREGPLRTELAVRRFWETRPEAQLAIVMGGGFAALDIDLKHVPGGLPQEPTPLPVPTPGGYTETTKSGGLHYLFRLRSLPLLPSGRRVIGLGGYVDLLAEGLLVTAPTVFGNCPGRYATLRAGGLPLFPTLDEALRSFAPWLCSAWEQRQCKQRRRGRDETPSKPPGVLTQEAEVAQALDFVRRDPRAASLFSEGLKFPDGTTDRSRTEYHLASLLQHHRFSRSATYAVICASPQTKSPRDRRGKDYFLRQVWERLPSAEDPG